jgi:hypothetical protein
MATLTLFWRRYRSRLGEDVYVPRVWDIACALAALAALHGDLFAMATLLSLGAAISVRILAGAGGTGMAGSGHPASLGWLLVECGILVLYGGEEALVIVAVLLVVQPRWLLLGARWSPVFFLTAWVASTLSERENAWWIVLLLVVLRWEDMARIRPALPSVREWLSGAWRAAWAGPPSPPPSQAVEERPAGLRRWPLWFRVVQLCSGIAAVALVLVYFFVERNVWALGLAMPLAALNGLRPPYGPPR